jgi:hypothetical protein
MGWVKETRSFRWDTVYSTIWETNVITWDNKWTRESNIDPRAFTNHTQTWGSETNKWNELT